jgi:hypothetical protein
MSMTDGLDVAAKPHGQLHTRLGQHVQRYGHHPYLLSCNLLEVFGHDQLRCRVRLGEGDACCLEGVHLQPTEGPVQSIGETLWSNLVLPPNMELPKRIQISTYLLKLVVSSLLLAHCSPRHLHEAYALISSSSDDCAA